MAASLRVSVILRPAGEDYLSTGRRGRNVRCASTGPVNRAERERPRCSPRRHPYRRPGMTAPGGLQAFPDGPVRPLSAPFLPFGQQPLSALLRRSLFGRRLTALDPEPTFKGDPRNGRKARESGLRLKTSVAPGATVPEASCECVSSSRRHYWAALLLGFLGKLALIMCRSRHCIVVHIWSARLG